MKNIYKNSSVHRKPLQLEKVLFVSTSRIMMMTLSLNKNKDTWYSLLWKMDWSVWSKSKM